MAHPYDLYNNKYYKQNAYIDKTTHIAKNTFLHLS